MSLRDGPLGDIKPPLAWLTGLVLVLAGIGAAALLLLARPGGPSSGPIGEARRAVDSVAGPAGGALSTPVNWIRTGSGAVSDYLRAASQNRELRAALDRDRAWRDQALALRQENARLRALLGVKTDPPLPMVFADTVLDTRGPFSNSRVADAGLDRGVAEGNPALSEHGLVGRVVGVAPHVSRIMLLTDVQSRTPVLIARTNGRAILTGDGGPNPALSYLRTHDALRVGDRVLTSGDGGVFPRGLPVGSAVKGYDGLWRVALDSDAEAVDYVRILLFRDFAQLAGPAALAAHVLPSTSTDAPEAAPPAAAPPASPKTPGKAPKP